MFANRYYGDMAIAVNNRIISGFFESQGERSIDEKGGIRDWICTFYFSGIESSPDFSEASVFYLENHFDRTPLAKGSTLYLVARTIAAFGRCVKELEASGLTICIAFHDQTPITRISEAA